MELDMFHSQEVFAVYIKLHALLWLFVPLSYTFRCAGELANKEPEILCHTLKIAPGSVQMGLQQSLRWQV